MIYVVLIVRNSFVFHLFHMEQEEFKDAPYYVKCLQWVTTVDRSSRIGAEFG